MAVIVTRQVMNNSIKFNSVLQVTELGLDLAIKICKCMASSLMAKKRYAYQNSTRDSSKCKLSKGNTDKVLC